MTYSYTQISHYLSCPRRYRHRYLDGWQEKDNRASMLFGRAFEQALAALFRREDPAGVLFEQWSLYKDMGLTYSGNDTWDRMLLQSVQLLERFVQDNRIRIRRPRHHQQIQFRKPVAGRNDFVSYVDAIGELDRTKCVLEWKTISARYPEEPVGISALDPQLVCYSWMTGIDEVAQVVFVRKRLVEVQYLRATISDEQRREFAALVEDTTVQRIESGSLYPIAASDSPRILVPAVPSSGSASASNTWSMPRSCTSPESTLVCLTNLFTRYPPMPPKLNRKRAIFVLTKIDEILAWEKQKEAERDTRFVELGRYLCEVRAGQYWRLENLKSFDEFLTRRFPESRRKAYYLMSIHEHLPPQARRELKEVGWTKGLELAKVARRDGQHFDCATWLHKAREMPKEDFRREVERELTGQEQEPSDLIYFKLYESQIPVIEQAIEAAALMLGSDKSRGYCLEMICADFLAGAHLDNGNPEILLHSISRYYLFLPASQKRAFLERIVPTAS